MGTNGDMQVNTALPLEIMGTDFMNFCESIAELIQLAKRSVEKSVNTAMVVTYYEVGRRIIEREQGGEKRAQYGKHILQGLSAYLTKTLGKGYSVTNLKQMRTFYTVYGSCSIRQMASDELSLPTNKQPEFNPSISWSQYIKLMRIANKDERRFYELEIADNGWNLKEFERQFDSALYERLALSRNKEKIRELSEKGQIIETPQDMFKDSYVLEFTGLPERAEYTESDLEQKLIDHIQQFLLELGKGFAFIKRQARFTFEEESFFVDLVMYNRLLHCFVLIDLKIGQIRYHDIGQMQLYVNYYDRKVKTQDENPTIGIVLCRDKNNAVVEMMLPKDNNQIFAAKYQTILPSKEELRRVLERDDFSTDTNVEE